MSQPTSFVLAPGLVSPSVPDTPKADFPPPDFLINPAFPQARWSFGGALLYDNALSEFLKFVRGNVPAAVIRDVSGAPPCAWSLDWFAPRPPMNSEMFGNVFKRFAGIGVPVALDFDNPFISENALDDALGNAFLRDNASHLRVRVASETLAERIRSQFPQAKICAGANLAIAENARGNADFYRRATEKFDTTTLHPLDAANADFLEKLLADVPADRLEIELNDNCLRDCPLRREHLEMLAKMRLAPYDITLPQKRHALLAQTACENVCNDPANTAARPATLTRDEWNRAYALGIRDFRIQAEKLRSEIAFFWELGTFFFTDVPEFWHKKATVMSATVNNISMPVQILKSGTNPFVMRKY